MRACPHCSRRLLALWCLTHKHVDPYSTVQTSRTTQTSEATQPRFVLMSPEIMCCPPYPLGTWLRSRWYLRVIGSLMLYSVLELASFLLPQAWMVPGFALLAAASFVALSCLADNPWEAVPSSLSALSILAALMWWWGLLKVKGWA